MTEIGVEVAVEVETGPGDVVVALLEALDVVPGGLAGGQLRELRDHLGPGAVVAAAVQLGAVDVELGHRDDGDRGQQPLGRRVVGGGEPVQDAQDGIGADLLVAELGVAGELVDRELAHLGGARRRRQRVERRGGGGQATGERHGRDQREDGQAGEPAGGAALTGCGGAHGAPGAGGDDAPRGRGRVRRG
ncbi:hypothetical protein MN205_06675 [Kineococcus sp. TRM81007]|nr:hypothetical protein [Kineococcus sp. TRM81007]MCI2238176.1 hypothetical protein [Kineococcus sp. TRM81007]